MTAEDCVGTISPRRELCTKSLSGFTNGVAFYHHSISRLMINNALSDIYTWTNNNNLKINLTKTKCMQFHSYNSNSRHINIKYNEIPVEETSCTKFLGLNIDTHLNWKKHIESICTKLDRFVYALRRLGKTVSTQAAMTAYYGYVSSTLNYGLLIWGNSVHVDKAFILQKKCVRAITNAWYTDSCKPIFKKHNILPLACMYIKKVCIFVKTHMEYFKLRSEIYKGNQRAQYRTLLYQPPCRADIYKRNAYNTCIEIFNKLPDSIKLLHDIEFKNVLTKWLQENCFYSVKEYMNMSY